MGWWSDASRPADAAPACSRRRSWLLLILVVALGSAGTGLAAGALHNSDRERFERALTQQTALVSALVAGEIRRYTGFLADLAAALGAQGQLEAAEFAATTAQMNAQRLPGASGVNLLVPASLDQIPQVQAFWRARGATDLTLRPNGAADEHQFVVLSRSFDGKPPSVGRDLSASVEASEALRLARSSGQVTASRTYRLLKDALLPIDQQQQSFVFAAPVYATSPVAEDSGQFRGWLVMGLRGADFLRRTIGLAAGDSVAVTLSDATDGDVVPVATWQPPSIETATSSRQVIVPASQRSWQLSVRPTQRLLPAGYLNRATLALLIGGILTGLLAALTRTVLTSRDRALRRVDAATAALRDDIRRREAVETQLRQRETELKGFAGVVAHDLRNPLARIAGYTDVLREYGLTPPSDQHLILDRIRAGTQQMQALIDDLLTYATADNRRLHPVTVDLHHLVRDVVDDRVTGLEPRPAITVGELPVVEGDPTLLRQVFDNLIGNALKYTEPGRGADVEISASADDPGRWRVEIHDRGIGIATEQRSTVFDAFVRAPGSSPYPGTGLGLAIVARIVERHGGAIGVTGNPGGGSIFWFTLPSKQDLPEPVSGMRAGAAPLGRR